MFDTFDPARISDYLHACRHTRVMFDTHTKGYTTLPLPHLGVTTPSLLHLGL